MRWLLALLGWFVFLGVSTAAPLHPEAPQPTPKVRAPVGGESPRAFAQMIVNIVQEIEGSYVRPVKRTELIYAALVGLHEAARVPVPPTLRIEVDKLRNPLDESASLQLLNRVRDSLGDPEPLRYPADLIASVRAMARTLDPHSGLVTAEEMRRDNRSETQAGVGIELQEASEEGPVVIRAVAPGGPAQRAGLRPGDEITQINGEAPTLSLVLLAQLKGRQTIGGEAAIPIPVPNSFSMVVRRPGARQSLKVKLEPESFRPETILGGIRLDNNRWDYWLDREKKIAHVRVANLANGTAGELKQVLMALRADGLRGLLLDLRWCPGGYLNESLDMAQLFLGECIVATVKSRIQGEDTYRSVRDEAKLLDLPMAVLVNAETSGGAELVAAALQDNGRALIAGTRTRGKASVQTMAGLPIPNTGLKLTSGTFFRPSGKNLNRFPDSKPTDDWGVRPEPKHEARVSADLNRQLREAWQLQTLRPGTSREALPLDDPRADPQRVAGLRVLLEQVK